MLHDEGIEKLIDWLRELDVTKVNDIEKKNHCIMGLRELQQTRKDLSICEHDKQEWFEDWFKQSKLTAELLMEMVDLIEDQSMIRKAKDLVFSFYKLSSIL